MKKLLFTFILALLATVSAWAQSYVTNDLMRYEVDEEKKTAKLDGPQTGVAIVDVPSSFFVNRVKYKVIGINPGAFARNKDVTTVKISDENVVSIGDSAFSNCPRLKNLTIGKSVQHIGDGAFKNCSALTTELTIPESVTSIGKEAFQFIAPSWMNVEPVIPPTVGADAFKGVSRDIYLYVGYDRLYREAAVWSEFKNMLQIGGASLSFAFNGLEYEVIPGTKNVGVSGYDGAEPTGKLDIPASVTHEGITYTVTDIFSDVFIRYESLTQLTVPNSVINIGRYAFYRCNSLAQVTLPNNLKTIGESAFSVCKKLKQISIPGSVKEIGKEAFSGCFALEKVTMGEGVTLIGESAFSSCESLTQVTIPNSVTDIGIEAFCGCESLTQVTIPGSVKTIGKYAFSSCKALEQINVDNANTAYSSADGVLFNKDKTELIIYPKGKKESNYIIPGSVKTIKLSAFSANGFITRISIPDAVTTIESSAFNKCNALAEMTLGKGVTHIGNFAFFGCAIRQLTIPNSVKVIEGYAFNSCKSLEELTIGSAVDSLGTRSFATCTALRQITALADVPPKAKYDSFDGVSLDIPVHVPAASLAAYKVANVWKEFTNLQAIVVNEFTDGNLRYEIIDKTAKTVKVIGYVNTPKGAQEIPSTVEQEGTTYSVISIGKKAFYDCTGLTSLTLPASLTSIETYALYNCSGLTKMTVFATTPPTVEGGAFYNISKETPVYVPAESLEDYKASVWKGFTNLQAIQ